MADLPSADIEALLTHSRWVRSLALRLTQDDAQADDLVQDTWLSALGNPPRHSARLRGWLGRLMRHRWLHTLREQSRRTRREHQATRPEAMPSVEEITERAALQRELVEEVMNLAPHYWEVVLLRFFEDLPLKNAAVQLDVPLETVRTRLRRALTILRDAVEKRHGVDEWRQSLLALAAPAAGTATLPAAAASALTGGTMMAIKWKVASFARAMVHPGRAAEASRGTGANPRGSR